MQKECAICGTPFETKDRTLFCTASCRQEHSRRKSKQWNLSNPDKVREINKRTQAVRRASGKEAESRKARRSSKAGYLDRFLERIRANNPATDITRSYLEDIFLDRCAVSGVGFKYDRTLGTVFINPYAPSIDRVDSKLPYQRGNVQIVLAAVNFGKNAMTMDDFTHVWRDITQSWAALTKGGY